MRCSEVRRLLVREEAVGYGTAQRPGVERHLRDCACCREEAAALEAEARLIRLAFSDPPLRPGFTCEVLDRIGAGPPQSRPMP